MPLFSLLVKITMGSAISRWNDFSDVLPDASCTFTVKSYGPVLEGMPERTPAVERYMPAGMEPFKMEKV